MSEQPPQPIPTPSPTSTPPSSSTFPLIICSCGKIPTILIKKQNQITISCTCSLPEKTLSIREYLSSISSLVPTENTTCTWTQEHFLSKTKGIDYCTLCQKWLCVDCIKIHNQFDSLLNQKLGITQSDDSSLKCCKHSKDVTFSYCITCEENFCEKTDKKHIDNKHSVIRLKDLRNKNQVRNIHTNLTDAKEFIIKVGEKKNELVKQLENTINELNNNYEQWKSNFESYLEVIDVIKNEYIKNTNSFQAIMNLINNSLFIDMKQNELNNDIINVSNLQKVNDFFKNISVIKEINIDLSQYINRFSEITIWRDPDIKIAKGKEDEEKKNDIALINKNVEILNKLKMQNITNIREYTQNYHFDNLASLKLYNCQVKNLDFQSTFPSLNKVLFKKSISFDFITLRTMTLNLQVISFEKCNLITNEFAKIMNLLMDSENIRKSVQSLSFAKNTITSVDLNQYIVHNKQTPQLIELDFSKNKIFKFMFGPEYAPKIRVINLSNNNLTKYQFYNFKKEKTLILANKNLYLTGDKDRIDYLKTLSQQLSSFTFKLQKLSLSGLYNKFNRNELESLIINPQLSATIKRLDLSMCSLENDMLIKFILNNKANFPELQVLNLNDNYINDDFFELYRKHNLHLFFPKLAHVYLNGNDIKGNNFSQIGLFIQENKQLTKIEFCKNPFNKDYSATNTGKTSERGSGGKNNDDDPSWDGFKAKIKNGEEIEINDFCMLLKLVKFYDSDEGRKIRNENKNEKGFLMKFDLYKRFNFDNSVTYNKYKIEKKVTKK